MTFEQILQLLLGSTGALVALVIAIKWLDKDRNRLLGDWKTERDARMTLIEDASRRCSEDRIELHKKVDALELEIRSMLKAMLGHNFEEGLPGKSKEGR